LVVRLFSARGETIDFVATDIRKIVADIE